jgi:uncharacterized protein YkwD
VNQEHFQRRAKHRLVVITCIICVVGVTTWFFATYSSIQEFSLLSNSVEQFAVTQAEKTFLAPPPLTVTSATPKRGLAVQKITPLTVDGVITDTNVQRASSSLSALSKSPVLNDIAALRLQDMFTNQYFAHVSPSGESALTVASDVGYSYLAVGENLALGNFAGDQDVVAAWMASPGHRENILNEHYTQIGVAVGKGTYKGATTWIAVQVFGRPASDCPAPDANLKVSIDASETQLNQMAVDLSNDDSAVNAADPKYGPDYNDKVGQYNALVQQYNALAAQVKQKIAQYNAEVQGFNGCLGQ